MTLLINLLIDFADRHSGRGELTAWIGLNNLRKVDWQWTEESALEYHNWAPNEPNNAHENCVNIYVNYPSSLNKKWNDFRCDWNLSSICEKPACSVPSF
ncbi:chondroitin sulfate proteoglycan 2 isoform 2 [Aphelenchoides avenae]|nr:chondroitin sulfate proteoglycan 2 isoform 2 [Aphelenchus avenae]